MACVKPCGGAPASMRRAHHRQAAGRALLLVSSAVLLLFLRAAAPGPGWTAPAGRGDTSAASASTEQGVENSIDRDHASRRNAALLGASLVAPSGPSSAVTASGRVGGEAVTLNNGLVFPKASFGLQIYDDSTAQSLTETAISVGYRNFFASVLAGNQKGFAKGVAASGIPRQELFICGTVLSNRASGFENAYRATKRGCDENLKAFAVGGITYVDMIMLDYPAEDCNSVRGQWKAFEEMLAEGTTKSLAVSNFSPEQLDCILSNKSATAPTVNQLAYNVGDYDPTAVQANKDRGILVQAWSPLGAGRLSRRALNACDQIGKNYGKSAQQVALRWIVDTGATFSTQTRKKEHFEEDINIFDFKLTDGEIERLNAIGSR